jgi:hypothetical protein
LRNVKRVFRTVVTASAIALVSIAAHAATVHLTGDLKASAEVPPKDSPGAGTVTATLDTETNEFKYHVEFSGLTGPAVAAHFHGPATTAANAKPQLPIINPTCHLAVERMCQITSPVDGMWTLTHPDRLRSWWMVSGISISTHPQIPAKRFAAKF